MKKIRAGKYEYKGYIITNMGYYEPNHSVIWEAVDMETGRGDFHAHTKKHIKQLIDEYFEKYK